MKKMLSFLLLLLVSILSLHAFDITDLNQNQRTYFSLSDSDLIVSESSNVSQLEVSYFFNSSQISKKYNFTQCDSKYCVFVDLLDLFSTNNQSTSIPNEFTFIVGSNNKKIYLDVIKPDLLIQNEAVDRVKNTLEVNFTYSDNSNSIKKVELYIKKDISFVFEKTLTTSYFSYLLENQNEIEYQLRVVDQAGNVKIVESEIEIGDIFEPKITHLIYTLKENKYEVEFKITDESLNQYSFTQTNISLQEKISGSQYSKTLILPFSKGDVIFMVEDVNGNNVSRLLSLKDDISISSMSRYSNEEKYSFTSNAQSCTLLEVDGKSDTSKFIKSGSKFIVDISVSKFEDIDISFYCEKNNFRKYFNQKFFYDTSSPDDIYLSIFANERGEIELNWTKSEDEHLDVTYIVYRNSDEIYEGLKTKFIDDHVTFPNTYEYMVEVIDLAGNLKGSEEVDISPVKTTIDFFVITSNNQVVQDSLFTLVGMLEEGTHLKIEVKNNNNLIDTKTLIGKKDEQFSSQVILQKGLNSIFFEAKDTLDNIEKKYLYVTYEPIVQVVQKTTEIVESNLNLVENTNEVPVAIIEKEPETTNETKEEVVIEKSFSYWMWVLLFLLILLLFLYVVFSKENVLRERFNRKSKELVYNYSKSRKTDLMLGKNLEKTKQERIRKQKQEEDSRRKIEENKKKVEENEYQKQKLKELSYKKEVHFSDMTRKKAERRVNKIKRETSYEDELTKIKEQKEQIPFFKRIFTKQEKEVKEDAMSEYIEKQKNRTTWNDTYSYRLSHVEKLKAQEDAKIKAIEDEKKLKELTIREEQTKKQFEQDKKQREESHLSRETSAQEFIEKSKEKRLDLDDYLGKRTKKKRFFFAEKEVERDLRSRR